MYNSPVPSTGKGYLSMKVVCLQTADKKSAAQPVSVGLYR